MIVFTGSLDLVIELNLKYPLYTGGIKGANVHISSMLYQAAEDEIRYYKRENQLQQEQAIVKLDSAFNEIQSATRAEEIVSQTYQLFYREYVEQNVSSFQLWQTQDSLFSAQQRLIEAKAVVPNLAINYLDLTGHSQITFLKTLLKKEGI